MTNRIAEINARVGDTVRVWGGYELKAVYRVGKLGMRGTGAKTHVVLTEVITAILDGSTRRKVGQIFSAHIACTGNCQFNSPSLYADDTEITCKFCK